MWCAAQCLNPLEFGAGDLGREVVHAADVAFDVVRDAFRACKVDAFVFCAARKVYDQAQAEFDVAFAAEAVYAEAEELASANAAVAAESAALADIAAAQFTLAF